MEMSSVIKNAGSEFSVKQVMILTNSFDGVYPGPRDGAIQCFIKRDKSNMTYHLHLALSPGTLVESGKFLLSAKRTRRITYTEYVISMDANNISRSSDTYIGKLRSNILGTKFTICDTAPAYLSPPNQSLCSFKSKKVTPKISLGSYNIAQVTYKLNLLKTRGPRKIHCIMHSIPALALEPNVIVPERSFDESFDTSKIIDHSGVQEEGKEQRPLVLRNKMPRWHEALKCWCLNFKGRVTVASVKNFQLMTQQKPGGESDDGKVILQFGKVDKDLFTMDYGYPLSAFQAFAICLTSFDFKLACE